MKVFYLVLMLLIAILSACGTSDVLPTQVVLPTDIPPVTSTPTDADTPTPSPTATATSTPRPVSLPSSTNEQAAIAFVQTIEGLPDVDIYVDASAYAFAMRYGQTTQLSDLRAGTYTISLMPAGISLRSGASPFYSEEIVLAPQTTTVVALTGTVDAPQLMPFALSNAPLDVGQSRVGMVHLVNNIPSLSIRQSGIDLTLPVVYGQQTIPANILSGQTTIAIHGGETALATEVVSLRERENTLFIAYGNANAVRIARFNNRVVGRTTVRVVNISPVATVIDIYLNETLFASNVDYGRATERQQVSAGDYAVAVYPGGADISRTAPLHTTTLTPRQDESLTLIFMGNQDSLLLATSRDNLAPVPPEQARLMFVHALPDEGVLQPSFASEAIPFTGRIAYGQSTTGALLQADMQTLYFKANVGTSTEYFVEVAENLRFEEGVNYLYFITGLGQTATPIIISERVSVDERLAFNYLSEPTPVPLLPVYVRVLNMLSDRASIDVYVDDAPVVTDFPPARLSVPILLSAPETRNTIGVRLPNGEDNLTIFEYAFQRDAMHTIFIYGADAGISRVLVQREFSPSQSTSAFIRLVNLTEDPTVRFNMSVADSSVPVIIPEELTPQPVMQFREIMYANAQPIAFDIAGRTLSREVGVVPRLSDIYVIDLTRGLVAAKQLQVNLQGGILYDVIVIQNTFDIEVSIWVIAHTP